jgi:Uma2 family endonuclease
MSTLIAPTKSAKTAELLAENWLRNVFSSDLFAVRGYAGSAADPDLDQTPSVVVEHLHGHDGEPPVLVIEVSDAPVGPGAADDAGRHAAAGVLDFWVIEVKERRIHVFRDPRPDADAPHGFRYHQVRVYGQFALIAPLAAEIHLAQVINLLPY